MVFIWKAMSGGLDIVGFDAYTESLHQCSIPKAGWRVAERIAAGVVA
jgi:hypothetical protein